VGQELITAAISHHPGGLFWRTRVTNEGVIGLYSKIAETQTTEGNWVVFTAGVAADVRNTCVLAAVARPATITY